MKPNTLQSRSLTSLAVLALEHQFRYFNVFVGSWLTKAGSTSRGPAGTLRDALAIAELGKKANNNYFKKGRLLFGDASGSV